MIKVNFESDFKIIESFKYDVSLYAAPFKFSYYTKVSRGVFIASFDGETFTNCIPVEGGKLIIPFDNPQLGQGELMVKREFFLTDKDFADGECHLVSVETTNIQLDRGVTEYGGEIDIELLPYYQKGDKGDPLKYSDMTEADKKDLMMYVPTYATEEIIDITKIL